MKRDKKKYRQNYEYRNLTKQIAFTIYENW